MLDIEVRCENFSERARCCLILGTSWIPV